MINLLICLAASGLVVVKSSQALAGMSLSNSIVKRLVFVTSSLGITFTLLTCLSNAIGNSPLPEPTTPAALSTNLNRSPSSIANRSSIIPYESDPLS